MDSTVNASLGQKLFEGSHFQLVSFYRALFDLTLSMNNLRKLQKSIESLNVKCDKSALKTNVSKTKRISIFTSSFKHHSGHNLLEILAEYEWKGGS